VREATGPEHHRTPAGLAGEASFTKSRVVWALPSAPCASRNPPQPPKEKVSPSNGRRISLTFFIVDQFWGKDIDPMKMRDFREFKFHLSSSFLTTKEGLIAVSADLGS
jgi:hypothetical protein